MYLKVSDLQVYATPAEMCKHLTVDPVNVMSNPTVGNFYAAVKSFDDKIVISGNFV